MGRVGPGPGPAGPRETRKAAPDPAPGPCQSPWGPSWCNQAGGAGRASPTLETLSPPHSRRGAARGPVPIRTPTGSSLWEAGSQARREGSVELGDAPTGLGGSVPRGAGSLRASTAAEHPPRRPSAPPRTGTVVTAESRDRPVDGKGWVKPLTVQASGHVLPAVSTGA